MLTRSCGVLVAVLVLSAGPTLAAPSPDGTNVKARVVKQGDGLILEIQNVGTTVIKNFVFEPQGYDATKVGSPCKVGTGRSAGNVICEPTSIRPGTTSRVPFEGSGSGGGSMYTNGWGPFAVTVGGGGARYDLAVASRAIQRVVGSGGVYTLAKVEVFNRGDVASPQTRLQLAITVVPRGYADGFSVDGSSSPDACVARTCSVPAIAPGHWVSYWVRLSGRMSARKRLPITIRASVPCARLAEKTCMNNRKTLALTVAVK